MNWRKGFNRTYLVISIIWIVYLPIHFSFEYGNGFNLYKSYVTDAMITKGEFNYVSLIMLVPWLGPPVFLYLTIILILFVLKWVVTGFRDTGNLEKDD